MTTTIQGAPALVVEMMSPGERMSKIQHRIFQFLEGGVGMVWLIDPED